MSIKSLPIRKEVFEVNYQPAPKLGQILEFIEKGTGPQGIEYMADVDEFFDRTVITESMLQIFESILEGFEGKRKKVFVLRSFYGGGKTHTILAILHAFRDPDSLKRIRGISPYVKLRLEEISEKIKKLGVKIVCFAGDSSVYSGNPLAVTKVGNYAYRTVWGYIAHCLGNYLAIKEFDETLTAPQVDLIKKLLGEERILFLFDEVAEYVSSFVGGDYRYYAKSVVNFMEFFCKAVSTSKCVALITLPFEGKNVDFRFSNVDIITSLANALEKDAENFEPLRAGDVVEILKKRIFVSLPNDQKEVAVNRFKEARVNFSEYFDSNYEKEVERTYPFSPEYLEVLERLIRETRLQKTRAALEITIDTVRRVINDESDAEVLKPWHIDLHRFPDVFLRREEYESIYTKQVLVEPKIHCMILKTIFYYTFYYDAPSVRKEYPGLNDVVRAVYEPETFSNMNLRVVDIENELAKVINRSDIYNLYFSEGKYWFWKYPSIREYILKNAKVIRESDDLRLWDNIKKALEERFNYTGTKHSKINITHKFKSLIICDGFEYPPESEKLTLVIMLRAELAEGDFPKRIIMESGPNRSRTNKNTIVVLLPVGPSKTDSDNREYSEMLDLASRLVAIEEIENKIDEWYSDVLKQNREVIELQKKMLNSEKSKAEKELADKVVRVYSWVVFPADSDVKYDKIVDMSMNIAEGVWKTLAKNDNSKVAEKLDITYFTSIIKKMFGIDVEKDEKAWNFRTIKSWFKQYPSLPFVSEEEIERVVKEGVKKFKFGIRTEKGVFFKKVHSQLPPTKDAEGVVPDTIEDDYVILTREKAINEQINFLLSEERMTDKSTPSEEIRFVLYPELGGTNYPLSNLRDLPNWKNLFIYGVIVREVRKIPKEMPRLDVKFYPAETLNIGKNEIAKWRISAIPYNFSPSQVEIVVTSRGNEILKEPMERSGNEFVKEFSVTPREDEEIYTVEISTKPNLVESIKKNLRVKIKEESRVMESTEVGESHINYRLLEISEIKDFEVLKILEREKILDLRADVNGGAVAYGEIVGKEAAGTMRLIIDNMPADVAVNAALELAEYCSSKNIPKFSIRFKNVVLDRRLVESLKRLNGKVKFLLEVGGSE